MKRSCLLSLLLAWVLWIQNQSPTAEDWTGLSGFASEEKCLANMKEKLDTWRQFKDAKFNKNSVTFTGNNATMVYLCLPDTEDPRTAIKPKKGK